MQFKKKFEQEQSLAGLEQAFAGLEQASAGFEQGSANYLGWNRILRGSLPHGPPSLIEFVTIIPLFLGHSCINCRCN